MSINIGGSEFDQNYRYKMPAVTTTLLKKAGGTTVVDNTPEIAAALRRDPKHISKWLSKKLNQPVQLKNGKWVLKGDVAKSTIQGQLTAYISAWVLCRVCGNPETTIGKSCLTCTACGGETKF